MSRFEEPKITINGIELSFAEAMTFRVSLGIFAMSLASPDSLGGDEHGKSMVRAYTAAIGRINAIIMKEDEDAEPKSTG